MVESAYLLSSKESRDDIFFGGFDCFGRNELGGGPFVFAEVGRGVGGEEEGELREGGEDEIVSGEQIVVIERERREGVVEMVDRLQQVDELVPQRIHPPFPTATSKRFRGRKTSGKVDFRC